MLYALNSRYLMNEKGALGPVGGFESRPPEMPPRVAEIYRLLAEGQRKRRTSGPMRCMARSLPGQRRPAHRGRQCDEAPAGVPAPSTWKGLLEQTLVGRTRGERRVPGTRRCYGRPPVGRPVPEEGSRETGMRAQRRGRVGQPAWPPRGRLSGAYYTAPSRPARTMRSSPSPLTSTSSSSPRRNEMPPKPGKSPYRGALLEVTYLAWNALSSAQAVLASHHLPQPEDRTRFIADPTGRLRNLQACISLHFAERRWVRRRCENVLVRIEDGLRSIDPCAPFHDQVTAWLFPTGITTHVLLLAALRNPTVRRSYDAVRETLREYDLAHYYPELLALLGCAHLPARRVGEHLDALAETFDAAVAVAKTPFPFSSDITALARPITVEGSRQLIGEGHHHEAVFWIVARCALPQDPGGGRSAGAATCQWPGFREGWADLVSPAR